MPRQPRPRSAGKGLLDPEITDAMAMKGFLDQQEASAMQNQKAFRENEYAEQAPLAENEIMRAMLDDKSAQTDYAQAPRDYKDHFNQVYSPQVANRVPDMWNVQNARAKGQSTVDHVAIGPDGQQSMIVKPQSGPQFDEFTTPQQVMGELPASEASMAKSIADYSMPISALGRIPAANKMRILSAAKVLNPDWDVKEYDNMRKARQAFTTGQQGQNIAAINTAIGHLGQLDKLSKELNGTDYPLLNKAKNFVSAETGNPRVTQFDQTKEAVASELAKVFKGSGVVGESQMDEWRKAINASMSPKQLKAAINNAVHLMGSRIEEMDRQWGQITKTPKQYRVLSDHSRRILDSLGADHEALEPSQGAQGAPEAQQQNPNDPYIVGKTYWDAKGNSKVYKGDGKWE